MTESTTMFCTIAADLNASLDGIPRYLFRVSDPFSPGTTTATSVHSQATENGGTGSQDLYSMERGAAADLLNSHLQWQYIPGPSRNLMSWTSSLLFALYYALYRKHKNPSNDDSDVLLLAIDTRQFRRGVFARELQAIEGLKGYSAGLEKLWNIRSDGRFYFGEYLSQGSFSVDETKAHQISLKTLRAHGLLRLFPELEQDVSRLACRVNELRNMLTKKNDLMSRDDMEIAMNVAGEFPISFRRGLAIMLLALTPKEIDPNMVWKLYRERKLGSDLGLLGTMFGSHFGHLPEVERCQQEVEKLQNVSAGRNRREMEHVDELANLISDLSIVQAG